MTRPFQKSFPEPWATEWGEDRFGPFMCFGVGTVVQMMRFCPPGSFLMGSPEHEAGRNGDEGPQHLVEISNGFWMADTPVTQALWETVMGENPSAFKSPERPVENVSWDDAHIFLGKLNEREPDLHVRLPSEAEWEYACRAGTETATWLGDLDIRGSNNAPLLDKITWYGGNCGKNFDLAMGYNTKAWPQKQYEHQRGGTRLVKQKDANPWGLSDMLGNVYEWCEDPYQRYDVARTESVHNASTRANCVLRGGSWGSDARLVRAAHRGANGPGSRYANLGFRLART